MLFFKIYTTALFSSLALGISFDPNVRTDTFDDLGTFSGPVFLPDLQDKAPRDGAIYTKGYKLVTSGGDIGVRTGIKPKSDKNVAILLMSAKGNITTNARCIKLEEFYHGCTTTNVQPNVNIPVECKIILQSFDEDNKHVETKEVFFRPNNPAFANMSLAAVNMKPAKVIVFTAFILPEFVEIVKGLLPILPIVPIASFFTAALLDNIKYIQSDRDEICGSSA